MSEDNNPTINSACSTTFMTDVLVNQLISKCTLEIVPYPSCKYFNHRTLLLDCGVIVSHVSSHTGSCNGQW